MCCSGPEIGVPDYLYPSVGDKGLLVFHEDYKPGTDVRPILGVDDTIVDFEILGQSAGLSQRLGRCPRGGRDTRTQFRKPEIKVEAVPGKMDDYVHIDVQGYRALPALLRAPDSQREDRPVPDVDAQSAERRRRSCHQQHRRYHKLRNAGNRPPDARLRSGQGEGQPYHRAPRPPGETITTLDGKERALTPDMLMIADQTNATGIAGVMGGEESEITEGTTTVLFEIAAFDRTNIRLTTRALGLRTEASGRFERGVCAATCREAADRACQLVNLLNAGEVIDDVYDCYPAPKAEQTVVASVSRINARIGMEIPGEEMARILNQLSFKATLDGDTLSAVVPDFREDIEGEADLSEKCCAFTAMSTSNPPCSAAKPPPERATFTCSSPTAWGVFSPQRGFTKSATSRSSARS